MRNLKPSVSSFDDSAGNYTVCSHLKTVHGISWTPKAKKDLNAIILGILKTGKEDHFEADDSDSV